MMPKVSVYIATSLDGFIARNDGNLDWLDEAGKDVSEGEDCGYYSFMENIDCLVMGRNTFEKVLSFDVDWPYTQKRVVVLSSKPIEIPSHLPKNVSCSNKSPKQLLEQLDKEGVKQIYLDGGITIQRFLQEGLVDEMTITTIPVLLGNGIPLFGTLEADIPLKHIETTSFEFGFVISKYAISKTMQLR